MNECFWYLLKSISRAKYAKLVKNSLHICPRECRLHLFWFMYKSANYVTKLRELSPNMTDCQECCLLCLSENKGSISKILNNVSVAIEAKIVKYVNFKSHAQTVNAILNIVILAFKKILAPEDITGKHIACWISNKDTSHLIILFYFHFHYNGTVNI